MTAEDLSGLSPGELLRYSRHLVMPEVGLAGQKRLKAARVLCVGAGGLGSPLTLYLAAAGVGTIGLADFDVVDLSNIQRQVLYSTADVGRGKLEVAAERLSALNPSIDVLPHAGRLTGANVMDVIAGYDVVVDGTDNFPTRYLVNDACVFAGKPNVYGSVFRFDGQVSVFDAERGPCYRCLFPEPPPPGAVPSCAEGGVLGVLPGIIGSLQALEVIKLILGTGDALVGRLVLFDALAFATRELKIAKDDNCVVCGPDPAITEPIDYEQFCGIGAGGDEIPAISVFEYAALRESGVELLDVRTEMEWQIARIDGARLIPLMELPSRLAELDTGKAFVVTCHHGPRAVQAYHLMKGAGFERVQVLAGGMDAWAVSIDASMARY